MPTRPALFALALLVVVGCGPARLNEARTLNVGIDEAKSIDLPAVSMAQHITVEFEAVTAQVTVMLIKESDAKGDDGLTSADHTKALAKKEGKSDSFTAEVPANTATRVIVLGAKLKTDVSLRITNKK